MLGCGIHLSWTDTEKTESGKFLIQFGFVAFEDRLYLYFLGTKYAEIKCQCCLLNKRGIFNIIYCVTVAAKNFNNNWRAMTNIYSRLKIVQDFFIIIIHMVNGIFHSESVLWQAV